METSWIWLALVFFVIAFFYSMVGFGGGSSYLAVLALAGLSYQHIPPIALTCNLIVAGGGFIHFYRGGHFEPRKALPFIILSVPMAYLGGTILIKKEFFFLLLGLSLLAAAARMVIPDHYFEKTKEVSWQRAWMVGLPVGGGLGFLSGLVGIGGGIFLSPLLLVMRWVNVKQAAACASFFIFVNSFSGLIGQLQKGSSRYEYFLALSGAVFIGGQMGSRLGSFYLPKVGLQQLMAALILLVAVKLLSGVL